MKKFGTLFMLSCLTLQLVSSTVVYAEESTTQESTTSESTTESTTESSTTESSTQSSSESTTESTTDEDEKEKDFTVNKGIKLAGVFSDKEILVDTEGQLKLTTLKLPEGIKDSKKIKSVFKTSDKAIFSIDKDGKGKALKEGKVTIEFGYQLDDETKKALEEAGYKTIDTLNKIELTITKKKTDGNAKVQSEGMSIDLKKVIIEGQKYDLKPTVKKTDNKNSDKKETYEFVYDYDKDFMTISYENGKWQATAKKSGVTTIKYGYIVKDETESSKDSSSSSTSGSSSSKDSSSSSTSSSESSTTDSTSSSTSSSDETSDSSKQKARTVKEEKKDANVTLTEADKKNMAKEAIAVKESAEKTFLTNYGMTVSPIGTLTVGDKGTLADKVKVELPKDIKAEGTYGTYVFNNESPALIKMDQSGTYEALKDGTAKVSYNYLLDPKVLDELAKNKNFDLMDLATKDKYIDIEIKSEDGTDPMKERPILHKGMSVLLPETITVGEEYKFKLTTDSKLNFDGEFKIDYDKELFDITLNGNEGTLVAKKTGKVSFNYGYIPSETMYKKLVEENDGKALTNDPGTYTIDVQAVQKPAPLQKPDGGKNYPQTGEARNNWMLISGIVVVAAAGGMVWYQSKKKKMTK